MQNKEGEEEEEEEKVCSFLYPTNTKLLISICKNIQKYKLIVLLLFLLKHMLIELSKSNFFEVSHLK